MKRDISIDIIKFIAVLLITNSHMNNYYPNAISFLGSGGAIGDALFFFCSGFTLFLKPMERFDNWYKKRISRIYPSAICWMLFSVIFLGDDKTISYVLEWSGGWFVKCIMIYYVIIFLINKFAFSHLKLTFIITLIVIWLCFFIWDRPAEIGIYGDTYFAWVQYFIYMLFGAIIGTNCIKSLSGPKAICLLIGSFLLFYIIVFSSQRISIVNDLQIISMVPLLGIVYSMYSLCNCIIVKKMYNNSHLKWIIMFIGNMCLEVYIVQGYLLPRINLGIIFPINYVLAIFCIIVFAYILKCFTRLVNQTFSEKPYRWTDIFKII